MGTTSRSWRPRCSRVAPLVALLTLAVAAPAGAAAEQIGGGCTAAGCHADTVSAPYVHGAVTSFDCDVCHEAAEGEHRFTLSAESTRDLCVTCHDDPTAERAHVHGAVEMAGCDGCHDPHGSEQPKLLASAIPGLCTDCHAEQEDALSLPHVHAPVRDLGCIVCHDPHATDEPKLLLAHGNALCTECHAVNGTRTAQQVDAGTVNLFGRFRTEPSKIDGAPGISLYANGRGHPVVKHPVEAPTNPRSPSEPLWCASCHKPHGSTGRHLLFGSPTWFVCAQCHNK